MRLKVNKIKCLSCEDIIESKSQHSYVTCSCGKCSVDGGLAYVRRTYSGDDMSPYEELSEYEDGRKLSCMLTTGPRFNTWYRKYYEGEVDSVRIEKLIDFVQNMGYVLYDKGNGHLDIILDYDDTPVMEDCTWKEALTFLKEKIEELSSQDFPFEEEQGIVNTMLKLVG